MIDAPTAARIEAFEAGRARTEGNIGAPEVVAHIGTVVLLIGLGFLYGTQYQSLGTAGRLTLIGLLVAALAAFGVAVARSSAGYAIAGGVALFVVVNEVGFRHFAQSVGFPVVLLVSGITLIAVAGAMFRILPRIMRGNAGPPVETHPAQGSKLE